MINKIPLIPHYINTPISMTQAMPSLFGMNKNYYKNHMKGNGQNHIF